MTRVKRTETQMLESFADDPIKQANYVKDRVRKQEEKIAELIGNATPAARELILSTRPDLSRFSP